MDVLDGGLSFSLQILASSSSPPLHEDAASPHLSVWPEAGVQAAPGAEEGG